MLDLLRLFKSLQEPENLADAPTRFSAVPVASYELYKIAKDIHGAPTLLISVIDSSPLAHPSPIAIEHLTVDYDVHCHISHPDGTVEEGQFVVVHCIDSDHLLESYFLRIAATLILALGPTPSQIEVSRAITNLIELFRAITEPPRKAIQGLWAEMFLIANAKNPAILIGAWHMTPRDLFDFSAESQRIEVKSGVGRLRQHHFRLEQLYPPEGTKVLVASLLVATASRGTSLADLIDRIRGYISSDPVLLVHVDRIVGLTLGENWHHAFEVRFDYELARDTLAFYEPSAIPSVPFNIPPEVHEVHFKSDLTNAATVNLSYFKSLGGLFEDTLR